MLRICSTFFCISLYGAVSCCTSLYRAVSRCMVLYGAVPRCIVLYGAVPRCMVLYLAVWCCISLHGAVRCISLYLAVSCCISLYRAVWCPLVPHSITLHTLYNITDIRVFEAVSTHYRYYRASLILCFLYCLHYIIRCNNKII